MLLALELDGFLQGWRDGDEIGGGPPLVVVVDGRDMGDTPIVVTSGKQVTGVAGFTGYLKDE